MLFFRNTHHIYIPLMYRNRHFTNYTPQLTILLQNFKNIAVKTAPCNVFLFPCNETIKLYFLNAGFKS